MRRRPVRNSWGPEVAAVIAFLDGLSLRMEQGPHRTVLFLGKGSDPRSVSYDWDTNYGTSNDDLFYAEASHILHNLAHSVYLVNMKPDWILGYWNDFRAKLWTNAEEAPWMLGD